MTFFPDGFDPRADLAGKFELANINTPEGDFGFLIGVDGIFTDITGKKWYGSRLIGAGDLEMSIGGTAPAGEVTLSFFQDPEAESLVAEIKSLGVDYVKGRPITFYVQPFTTQEELYSPKVAPIQVARRTMRAISFAANQALDRSITVNFEGPFENRKAAFRGIYNTDDHARLIGAPNPSLEFIPRENQQEEKLFG